MTDLILPAGTTLTIDQNFAMAPKYGLFQMGDNAQIVLTTDVTLKADKAEFGANCTISARGFGGAPGMSGINGPLGIPGGNGTQGGAGGKGFNVSIEASLAEIGGLTVVADGGGGGGGGPGGAGGNAAQATTPGGDGGRGGVGGLGGDAGQINLTWTAAATGLPTSGGAVPDGHSYRSAGGPGGPGGAGGQGGVGIIGPRGATGLNGNSGIDGHASTPQITWRANLDALLWAQAQDIGPAARIGHRVAFDPKRGKLVLFGGVAGGAHMNDTWEWNGQFWTQVADTGPAGRAWHSMAFDPSSQTMLMFGGRNFEPGDQAGLFQIFPDTWSWDGETWIQLADTGPSARAGAAMAADPNRQRVTLFSGANPPGVNEPAPIADTWEWDGSSWTQVADTGPAGRLGAAMAFDSAAGLLTLFGGSNSAGAFGDTWTWNGTLWTQVADTGPSPRDSHAMASFAGAIVLFGGMLPKAGGAGGAAFYGDTWAWQAGAWRQIQDMGPSARTSPAMDTVSDATGDHVTLFGGQASAALQDTWRLVERV